jgi:hypothetical protein
MSPPEEFGVWTQKSSTIQAVLIHGGALTQELLTVFVFYQVSYKAEVALQPNGCMKWVCTAGERQTEFGSLQIAMVILSLVPGNS